MTNTLAEEQQNLPKTQETSKLLNETINTVSSESTRATEYNYEGFNYSINDDNTITITGYTGNDSAIIIPSEIDNKKVTVIGDRAFERCNSLESI